MDRKTAKAELKKLNEKVAELQTFLNKTCRHPKKVTEEISGGYDYFKSYETRCKECFKVLIKDE